MKKPLWTTILTCLTHMILPRLPAAQSTALEPWRSCCPGPKGRQPCSSSCWSVDTSPGIARVAVRWWGRHGWDMDVRYGGHSDTNTWMKHNKSLTWHKPVLSYLYFGIFTPILTIIPMTLPREVIIIYPEICRHRFRTRVGNKQNRWHFVHIHVHMHSHGNILSATSILQKKHQTAAEGPSLAATSPGRIRLASWLCTSEPCTRDVAVRIALPPRVGYIPREWGLGPRMVWCLMVSVGMCADLHFATFGRLQNFRVTPPRWRVHCFCESYPGSCSRVAWISLWKVPQSFAQFS